MAGLLADGLKLNDCLPNGWFLKQTQQNVKTVTRKTIKNQERFLFSFISLFFFFFVFCTWFVTSAKRVSPFLFFLKRHVLEPVLHGHRRHDKTVKYLLECWQANMNVWLGEVLVSLLNFRSFFFSFHSYLKLSFCCKVTQILKCLVLTYSEKKKKPNI